MTTKRPSFTVLKFKNRLERDRNTFNKLIVTETIPSQNYTAQYGIVQYIKRLGGQIYNMYSLLDYEKVPEKKTGPAPPPPPPPEPPPPPPPKELESFYQVRVSIESSQLSGLEIVYNDVELTTLPRYSGDMSNPRFTETYYIAPDQTVIKLDTYTSRDTGRYLSNLTVYREPNEAFDRRQFKVAVKNNSPYPLETYLIPEKKDKTRMDGSEYRQNLGVYLLDNSKDRDKAKMEFEGYLLSHEDLSKIRPHYIVSLVLTHKEKDGLIATYNNETIPLSQFTSRFVAKDKTYGYVTVVEPSPGNTEYITHLRIGRDPDEEFVMNPFDLKASGYSHLSGYVVNPPATGERLKTDQLDNLTYREVFNEARYPGGSVFNYKGYLLSPLLPPPPPPVVTTHDGYYQIHLHARVQGWGTGFASYNGVPIDTMPRPDFTRAGEPGYDERYGDETTIAADGTKIRVVANMVDLGDNEFYLEITLTREFNETFIQHPFNFVYEHTEQYSREEEYEVTAIISPNDGKRISKSWMESPHRYGLYKEFPVTKKRFELDGYMLSALSFPDSIRPEDFPDINISSAVTINLDGKGAYEQGRLLTRFVQINMMGAPFSSELWQNTVNMEISPDGKQVRFTPKRDNDMLKIDIALAVADFSFVEDDILEGIVEISESLEMLSFVLVGGNFEWD